MQDFQPENEPEEGSKTPPQKRSKKPAKKSKKGGQRSRRSAEGHSGKRPTKARGIDHDGMVTVVGDAEYIYLTFHDKEGQPLDVEAFRWPIKAMKPSHVVDELQDIHSILYDYLNGICNPPGFDSEY